MVGILGQIPLTATGSALLGTAGSAGSPAIGVLSGGDDGAALFGNIGTAQNSLLNQIKATAEQRLQDAKQTIDEAAKQRNDAINVQNNRWISVKAQINNAEIAVTNGQEAAQRNANTLLDM